MRMIVYISMAVEPFNQAVRDGSAGQKIMKFLDAIKPEAVYFMDRNGERTAMLIVDLPDASKIPSIVEPWMLAFNAKIEMHPCMVPTDLQNAGLDQIAKTWG